MQVDRRYAMPTASLWRQVGDFAVYPLRGNALLSLLALTGLGLLAWLPGAGWLFAVILYFSGIKYAFEILLTTAHGHGEAPAVVLEASNGSVWRLLGLLLVLAVAVKTALAFDLHGLAVLMLAGFALMQPGMVATLALEDGLLAAANPAQAFRMMARIGPSYLLIAATLFLIQAAVLLTSKTLAPTLPVVVGALLVDALFYWGLFASFHLLGRLLHLHHEALGFVPQADRDRIVPPAALDAALLADVEQRLATESLTATLAYLREACRNRAVSRQVHERFLSLLRQAGEHAKAESHTIQVLAILIQDGQYRMALGLLHETLATNPEFALPPEIGECLPRQAIGIGLPRLATAAWAAMLRADPRHQDAPQWALEAASILCELDDNTMARKLLLTARNHCRAEQAADALDAALIRLSNS